jgi:type I restriction enzyme S subunit
LITIAGTIGRVALVPENDSGLNCNQAVCLLRLKSDYFNPRFLLWALRSPVVQRQLQRFRTTATVTNVSLEQIASLQVPHTSLDQQRIFAEVLDKADELCKLRQRSLEKLDALALSIFCEMFGNVATNSKGWDISKRLGDVADIVSGITKGRKLNGQATRLVPYLAVANVQSHRLELGAVKYIEATEAEISRYLLQKNDLLLTEGGDADKLGRGTLWNCELSECIHQNHIFRVRLKGADVRPLFLSWLISSESGKRYFLRAARQTTGIATINMDQLRGFPLLLPPRDLQDEFGVRLMELKAVKGLYVGHLDKLKALLMSLQAEVFGSQSAGMVSSNA